MSLNILINNDVNTICRRYIRIGGGRRDIDNLKSSIEDTLYKYNEAGDQLLFLYGLKEKFGEAYQQHLLVCEHKDNPEQCSLNMFYIEIIFFIEQQIKRLNPSFDFEIVRPELDSDLIRENISNLSRFPKTAIIYQSGLDKLKSNHLFRNSLDDFRLALETLLKEILGNDKSLENQFNQLGAYLKDRGQSKEIINILRVILDSYSKYNNENIKHNDKANESEAGFITNLTSSMIRYLIELE